MPQATLFPASRELFRLVRTVADKREESDHMSDVEIGRIIGFESARTSRWKHGQIAVVDSARVIALSQAFDIDVSILIQVAAGYISYQEALKVIGDENKLIRFLGEQLVLPTDFQVMSITGGDGTMCRVIRRAPGHYHRRTKRLSGQIHDAEEDEPTILLVDNDKSTIRAFLNLTGSDTGINGVVASTGPEALVAAGHLTPQVIIFDLFIGGLDGFEALRSITSNEVTSEAQVVATSLLINTDITQSALGSGAEEVLQRPIKSRVLGRLVSRLQNTR